MKKPLIFLGIGAIALAVGIGLARSGVDLGHLRSSLAGLMEWRDRNEVQFALVYFAAYVAVTSLSLPFAIWMTLGAGALFGFGGGVLVVSLAATLGATISFLVARYLLRDAVRQRFGGRIEAVDRGIARDGSLYLFSLRLVPAIPFFLVNLLMALTRLPVATFVWASFLGMLPATAFYVNAGTRLSEIENVGDIASPTVVLSLLSLAIFPWLARLVLGLVKRRRVYARWTKPGRFDRNLIVIGGGAAGLVSAYIASAVKAKVTLVEAGEMGGDCLNYGCVPSKALIRSAKLANQMRHADRYGLTPTEPVVPFRETISRVLSVIRRIAPNDSVERYQGLGVEVIKGHARIVDPWTVSITPNDPNVPRVQLTTRSIIIATGAAPRIPDIPGIETTGYLTSHTIWDRLATLDEAPRRLVILGGGPIGCELAQALARLGSRVTLIEAGPRLLSREDAEVAESVRLGLAEDGVDLRLGHTVRRAGADGEKWVEIEGQGQISRVEFDEMLVAIGRSARLGGFGLEELGIPTGRVIETNEYLETIYPNIFAAGDVAGPFQLTHAGAHQAWYASVNALFGTFRRFRTDYRAVPAAVFTDPEVARVGLSEDEARARNIPFEVTRYDIGELDRAVADGKAEGFVKVLTVPGRDKILGAMIVGEQAGDLLAEFVLAIRHGVGLNGILSTVHSYPTLSEANKYAAGAWRRAHTSPRVLAILERYHAWRRGRR